MSENSEDGIYKSIQTQIKDFQAAKLRDDTELKRVPELLAKFVAEQLNAPQGMVSFAGTQDMKAYLTDRLFIVDGKLPFDIAVDFGVEGFLQSIDCSAAYVDGGISVDYGGTWNTLPTPLDANLGAVHNLAADIAVVIVQGAQGRLK